MRFHRFKLVALDTNECTLQYDSQSISIVECTLLHVKDLCISKNDNLDMLGRDMRHNLQLSSSENHKSSI